ncbi:hypothetical protein C7446_0208 [Kushneria sinocarnis]|uniref:Ubiquinone biosynthesis accessory factor UbiK n=1 Tax=Kushneria sinocarnis TaxID=595502 RepID=A0A420X0L9_9GAMM|nr:accessory factor UbiK family protein [Kushneria sinocarnis]RKR07396.1 hypothetical protein C7446_0208 [Kushneria sinocarnis]
MARQDVFGRLAQQIGERLQDASHAPEEIQRTVHGAMRGAFDRLELVSREDFDVMMEVLQRTRSRVEALEKQVADLEAALDEREGRTTPTTTARADQSETPADAPADDSADHDPTTR